MTVPTKVMLAVLWALTLVGTAGWTASAQNTQMGQEVRFLRSQGDGRVHRGVLVANFDGQWLPVELDRMPDGNTIVR